MITLTPHAVDFFDDQYQLHKKMYCHITLRKIGCSGYQYHVTWEDQPRWDTVAYQQWALCADPEWLFMLSYLTVDVVKDTLGQRKVVYTNPKTEGWCGCGESFMVMHDQT